MNAFLQRETYSQALEGVRGSLFTKVGQETAAAVVPAVEREVVYAEYAFEERMVAQEFGAAVWDRKIAEELSRFNKLANIRLDCSDIASSFNQTFNGGYIMEITPKTGRWLNGIEYGAKSSFQYHQVFVKGKYVYDPMYSSSPIKTSDFIKAYQSMNPTGIKILRH
ncbi:hypothetical protein [Arsenicibacter rosenii]|uniref:Uncharacterized protein n=1 Tax=Arsenicibacter rosenii TaxID=1750698 RepID=A0A1S2VB14_9BACT|nr:hypothetical protein [Arsenicibacter rosenii]OIN55610.1 hypothetical protein BLX24_29150 [Arsenicibacter rosenii]